MFKSRFPAAKPAPSAGRGALFALFTLILAALMLVSACAPKPDAENTASGQTPAPTPDTENAAAATPEPTAALTPEPTPEVTGPFELFDYTSDLGEGTSARLAELAAQIEGLAPVENRQFPDGFYLGRGIELGLCLNADEFEPVLLCRVDGNDILTVGGLRVGMELDELKTLYPEMSVLPNIRSAFYDFSDYDGVELEFDGEFRISAITYSVTR